MIVFTFTQRPWGPLYKRLFEMDQHPGKLYFPFARHRLILLFWLGNTFNEDFNHRAMMQKNEDYLLHFNHKYNRRFDRNTLNWRTSAHYLEISRIYMVEMSKKFITIENEMWDEHQRKKALNLK